MIDHKTASRVWALLLRHYPFENQRAPWFWRYVSDRAQKTYAGRTVTINVHGQRTYLNYGHAYPIFARRFLDWNNPLIEIVTQTSEALGQPIHVVDIGAGVGDTVLLLRANCPGMVARFHCIEGDEEFFRYLRQNFGEKEDVSLYQAMLSSAAGVVPSLVRHHAGSSASQGADEVQSTTVDLLFANATSRVHVIKVDTDGFDGKILGGAKTLIARDRPQVIFEWHPILCQDAGNSDLEHFEILNELGYDRFIFYMKYGHFSHFMSGLDRDALASLSKLALGGKHDSDWHYDVIALPRESPLSEVRLAELQSAKHRRSWF